MAILLTNADVERLLTMRDCIDIFEQAYRQLAEGKGLFRPRSDIMMESSGDGAYYDFKTMDGVAPMFDVAATRVDMDVLRWQTVGGKQKRAQVPVAPGGFFSGLLFIFSLSTTELIAIVPDGVIQRLRVGATNGLAAHLLANADANTVGIVGTGWQAGAQLMAITAIRKCKEIRCFSRSESARIAFSEQMSPIVGTAVTPVRSAAEAVEGVDVALCATSSASPVFQPEWIRPGMHISSIKRTELPPSVLEKADRVVVHSESMAPVYIHPSNMQPPEKEADSSWTAHASGANYPTLASLVAGKAEGRRSKNDVTVFVNNIGTGYQFAVMGALVYRKARLANAGFHIPSELLTQAERP